MEDIDIKDTNTIKNQDFNTKIRNIDNSDKISMEQVPGAGLRTARMESKLQEHFLGPAQIPIKYRSQTNIAVLLGCGTKTGTCDNGAQVLPIPGTPATYSILIEIQIIDNGNIETNSEYIYCSKTTIGSSTWPAKWINLATERTQDSTQLQVWGQLQV